MMRVTCLSLLAVCVGANAALGPNVTLRGGKQKMPSGAPNSSTLRKPWGGHTDQSLVKNFHTHICTLSIHATCTHCAPRCALAGVIMPTVGLGSSGGCHPDVDGTEDKCGNYNASLSAMQLGYRAFHDALS